MKLIKNKKLLIVAILVVSLGVFVTVASANHSWGKYHWDLSTVDSVADPLKLGDNTSSTWTSSLGGASSDWNVSVLKNQIIGGTNPACDPILGQVEVCNSVYGPNDWLGIAQIWAYRSGHITQALVKMNDTYFNTAKYDTPAWRNMVVCQEVGHTFGLDHQDENFDNANLNTCMDYTSDPTSNQHPNQHDYDELTKKYSHLNEPKGGGKGNGGGKGKKPDGVGADIDLNSPAAWGQAVKQDAQGNNSLFERDLGNGQVLITHVIWVN